MNIWSILVFLGLQMKTCFSAGYTGTFLLKYKIHYLDVWWDSRYAKMATFVNRNSDGNFWRILIRMAPKTKFRPEKIKITSKMKSKKKIDGADYNLSDTCSSNECLFQKKRIPSAVVIH